MTPEEEAEWHAWRRGDDLPGRQTAVTGSVIANIDSGAYGGMYAALGQRLGLLTNDISDELADRGHQWEPAIAQTAALFTGWHMVGDQTLLQHPEHPWMRHTTDGLAATADPATWEQVIALAEFKTRYMLARPTDKTWAYWRAQCQWGMMVTGLPQAVLAVGYIDDETGQATGCKIYKIDADIGHQTRLQYLAEEYRRHYTAGEIPYLEGADLDLVKEVNTPIANEPGLVELAEHVAADYLEAKAEEKRWIAARKAAESNLRQLIGASTEATAGDYQVKVGKPANVVTTEAKNQLMDDFPELATRTFIGSEQAKKLQPDAYAAAGQPIGTRRITIKKAQI